MELRQRREMNSSAASAVYHPDLKIFYGQAKGALTDAIDWSASNTAILAVRMSVASGDIVGSVQVSGPIYATSAGFVLNDGTNTATYAAVWAAGDEIAILMHTDSAGKMRIGVIPTMPESLNQLTAQYARGVSVFGHNAKIYAAVSMYANGLAILDISDLANVALITTLTNGGFYHGGPVKIGNRLFCAARESGLYVYDISGLGTSALGAPTILLPPAYGSTPKITGLLYDGTTDILYAYNRTGGWFALKNVSTTPSASLAWSATLRRPTESGVINIETHRGDVLQVGAQRILLAPSLTTTILIIEDITSQSAPVMQSYLLSTSVNYKCWDAKYLHGSYIVCSQWSYESTQRYRAGLAIYDVSDPTSPRLCSRWFDPGIPYHGLAADSPPLDIAVRDGVVYVSGGPSGLRIIDAGNPYHPVEISRKTSMARLGAGHGYASCVVGDGIVAAVGGDIPTNAGPVALDIFTGARQCPPHTRIDFYPHGGAGHYIDDFFAESGACNDGTRQWAMMYYPYSSAPAPEMSGEGKLTIPLTQNERAFGLLSPCKNMGAIYVRGRISLDTLPPANGYVYVTFATTRSPASGGATIVFLQLILQATADGSQYRAMVKYHNGSALVNTSLTSASTQFNPSEIYDFAISWTATGITVTMGSAPTISVSGDFFAAPRPKFVAIDLNRVDSTTAATFQVTFHDRLSIHDGPIDWDRPNALIWQSDIETSRLMYGRTPAVLKANIDGLVSDGDYCLIGEQTILRSTDPPYAVGVSIGPEHPESAMETALAFGTAAACDGTFAPLTNTSGICAIDQVQVWDGLPTYDEVVQVAN